MKRNYAPLQLFGLIFLLVLTLPGNSEARYGYGITTSKNVYYAGEPVRIRFSGAPGYNSDWICVVHVGHSDNDAGRNWQWMPWGRHRGNMTFYVSSPGDYEVRAYYNYRRNGYVVSARQQFTVMNKSAYRAYYQTQQPAVIENPEYTAQSWNDSDLKLKQAQYTLMERGYDTGSADGVLGARTKTAIRHFQRDNGLEPTGYLNRDTLAALGLLNTPATAQPAAPPAAVQYQLPPQQQPASVPPPNHEEPPASQINPPLQPLQPSPPPPPDSAAPAPPVQEAVQPPPAQQQPPPSQAAPPQPPQAAKIFTPWKGQVVTYTVLLSEPSVMADNLENIPKGSLVDVIVELEGFYKIRYNGKEGYIYTNFVKK